MTAQHNVETAPLRVLVVCTGNICRSPVAERVLQHRLDEAGIAAVVTSAGTSAVAGAAMTPQAAALVTRFGAAPGDHRARDLTPVLLDETDLVLTATRAHRAAVATMRPRIVRTAFTLREFARLATAATAEGGLPDGETATLNALIGAVSRYRGYFPPPAVPEDDDIVDPYRLKQKVYDEVGRRIDETTSAIVSVVAASVGHHWNRL